MLPPQVQILHPFCLPAPGPPLPAPLTGRLSVLMAFTQASEAGSLIWAAALSELACENNPFPSRARTLLQPQAIVVAACWCT